MIEIQESYLSSIENDKKEPSLSLLKRISKSLDIPLSMFFWEETDNLNNDSPETKIKKLLIELTKKIHKPKASDSSNHV
jgi:transcriptional regulator with XRE-family HTH domain